MPESGTVAEGSAGKEVLAGRLDGEVGLACSSV
jgi:hypothetical protein